jgi:hypothetical protein
LLGVSDLSGCVKIADDKAANEVIGDQNNSTLSEHDPHFEQIIMLPEVSVNYGKG